MSLTTQEMETASEVQITLNERLLQQVKLFAARIRAEGKQLLLADELQRLLDDFVDEANDLPPRDEKALRRMFRGCPEVLTNGENVFAVLRPQIGVKQCIRIHPESRHVEELSRDEYLEAKDMLVQGVDEATKPGLVIDFSPYFRDFPKVDNSADMGSGISFLNRRLSAQLYKQPNDFRSALLGFLRQDRLSDKNLLLNNHITDVNTFMSELEHLLQLMSDHEGNSTYDDVSHEMRTCGFERGWGNNVRRITETLTLLQRILENPEPTQVESLLGRLPLVQTVLMVSPHGWFAQDDVLGKPDTGGQVTYVLDQARAFERTLQQQMDECGVEIQPKVVVLTRLIPEAEGTTCNQSLEKIHGSDDCWIVRTPFTDEDGQTVPHWISRFAIWPYLERFVNSSRQQIVTELMGPPDLIVGHYSDGNLVAHRLAEEFGVTHAACVHALEKTKYLLSDMHWSDMEENYHFSLQFTADLLSYNSADFIITSSYREIGGTKDELGMIEAYELFSMPGLYRVRRGFDARLARHNIVPPGASEQYFFPFTESEKRIGGVAQELEKQLLSATPDENSTGMLKDPDKPFVFSMARMDRIKNLPGLVEMFGKCGPLRDKANLVLISSIIHAEESNDHEEIDQIGKIYDLLDRYELHGHVRWCAARLDKVQTGEMYRLTAERRGVFAQPALMETFGLTVVEAMICGLPVVVTCYGGPAEIVVDDTSGYVINPNDQDEFAHGMLRLLDDHQLWQRFSDAGIQRVLDRFTWTRHAQRVLMLANVHQYWNHLDVMNRQSLDQYIHTLYHAVFRPRAQELLG